MVYVSVMYILLLPWKSSHVLAKFKALQICILCTFFKNTSDFDS